MLPITYKQLQAAPTVKLGNRLMWETIAIIAGLAVAFTTAAVVIALIVERS